jgi:uncharacterized protein Yka (UPF0111/DUF47 family)
MIQGGMMAKSVQELMDQCESLAETMKDFDFDALSSKEWDEIEKLRIRIKEIEAKAERRLAKSKDEGQ